MTNHNKTVVYKAFRILKSISTSRSCAGDGDKARSRRRKYCNALRKHFHPLQTSVCAPLWRRKTGSPGSGWIIHRRSISACTDYAGHLGRTGFWLKSPHLETDTEEFKPSSLINGKWGTDCTAGASLRKVCFMTLNLSCFALNLLLLDDEITQYY